MLNINFNDGIKELSINGDESRILRVNLTDFGLIDRVEKSLNDIEKDMKRLKVERAEINAAGDPVNEFSSEAKSIRKMNTVMRKRFDQVFYEGAADIVFGKMNPLALNADGMTIYEAFMFAFVKEMKPQFEAASKKNAEHLQKYKKAFDGAQA